MTDLSLPDHSSNSRTTESAVHAIFPERWSPRSFNPHFKISKEKLDSIMEAAKWAPSCFNEQPWTFHLALRETKAFDQFIEVLTEGNQVWAKNTSVLGFVVGKKFFSKNGKDNSTFAFDCGAAWMSLTLEARMQGLYTHGMAGFDHNRAGEILNVDTEKEKVIAAFAIGQMDAPSRLPEKLQENEKPNSRKDLKDVYQIHEKF